MSVPLAAALVGCAGPDEGRGGPEVGDPSLASLAVGGVPIEALTPERSRYTAVRPAQDPALIEPVPTDPEAAVQSCAEGFDGAVLRCVEGSAELVLADADRLRITVTTPDGSTGATEVVLLPEGYPELTVQTLGEASPGWWFVAAYNPGDQVSAVLDADGVPLWMSTGLDGAMDLRVSPSGRITAIAYHQGELVGHVLGPDWEVAERWAIPRLDPAVPMFMDDHDFQLLENGNALMLGLFQTVEDTRPWGGTQDMEVLHNAILEVSPEGEVVWSWTTQGAVLLDDVAFWSSSRIASGYEYAHVNSMVLDPADGHLVVSARLTNQVLKIARTADTLGGREFQPGEVIWRLGGGSSDFAFAGDTHDSGLSGFYGQHRAVPTEGGLMVYDNAMVATSQGPIEAQDVEVSASRDSRTVEYALDFQSWTATPVRQYALEGSGETRSTGSAQRLPDGHTVIGWGSLSAIGADWPIATEVDAGDVPVQELRGMRATWSYRVFKFDQGDDGWIPTL